MLIEIVVVDFAEYLDRRRFIRTTRKKDEIQSVYAIAFCILR